MSPGRRPSRRSSSAGTTPWWRPCRAAATTSGVLGIVGLVGWRIVAEVVVPGFRSGSERAALAVAVTLPVGLLSLGFPVGAALRSISAVACFRRFDCDRGYLRVEHRALSRREALPSVTVVVAVHNEPLESVITPTLRAARAAADRYRGQANVVVCDDGIALYREVGRYAAVRRRVNLYRRLGVGVVARPAHPRPGRFPKASNLNTAMAAADVLEAAMEQLGVDHRSPTARARAVARLVAKKRFGRVHVRGDIGLGDLIMLLDKDSWVPADVLNRVVGTFMEDERVVIAQLAITALNPYDTPASRVIAHHTESLFDFIIPSVAAAGSPAPFVGHNAILRKAALRNVARPGEPDANSGLGGLRYWDEVVSEDLALSLRLQAVGGRVVYVWQRGLRTKEGVTRSYGEETGKLGKFAAGAAEMVVFPINQWLRGPRLNPAFTAYLRSSFVPWHAKVDLIFYLATFLAIGIAPLVLPTLLLGEWLLGGRWGQVWVSGFGVMAICLVVFGVIGSLAGILHQRRQSKEGRHTPIAQDTQAQLRVIVPTLLFWSSISFVIGRALARYLLSGRQRFGPTSMDPLAVHEAGSAAAARRAWALYKDQFAFAFATLVLVATTASLPAAHIEGASHVLVLPAFAALAQLLAPAMFDRRWRRPPLAPEALLVLRSAGTAARSLEASG